MDEDDFFDSFSRIEIILALEEDFGVTFSQDDISSLKSVGSMVRFLESKGS